MFLRGQRCPTLSRTPEYRPRGANEKPIIGSLPPMASGEAHALILQSPKVMGRPGSSPPWHARSPTSKRATARSSNATNKVPHKEPRSVCGVWLAPVELSLDVGFHGRLFHFAMAECHYFSPLRARRTRTRGAFNDAIQVVELYGRAHMARGRSRDVQTISRAHRATTPTRAPRPCAPDESALAMEATRAVVQDALLDEALPANGLGAAAPTPRAPGSALVLVRVTRCGRGCRRVGVRAPALVTASAIANFTLDATFLHLRWSRRRPRGNARVEARVVLLLLGALRLGVHVQSLLGLASPTTAVHAQPPTTNSSGTTNSTWRLSSLALAFLLLGSLLVISPS